MRRYNLFIWTTMLIIAVSLLACTASAQYWFQSGARGSNDAAFNNGASISIQTVYQNATNGSMGFWVGESLANGAFIQAGYEIPNASGEYTSTCGNSTKSIFLDAGVPTWFWEYFLPNGQNDSFCGGIGPNGSAGLNNSFNTYSFKSEGSNVWTSYFNNQSIGSINLGTSNSGPNPPSAFGEYAETNSNKWPMQTVELRDLAYYTGGLLRLVPQAYPSVSYGKGSLTALPNLYGVQEVQSFTNFFQIGSHVSTQEPTSLWHLGYVLSIVSQYGNVTGSGNYIAYSTVSLNAPRIVNISAGKRELFTGWTGTGKSSYTGNNTAAYVSLYSNTTERATWKTQYYFNATTKYGRLTGAGWYDANTTVNAYVNQTTINTGKGSRVIFSGWSNGGVTNKTTVYMDASKNVSALWVGQYLLNVTAQYGGATGSGWYLAGSIVNISAETPTVPINQSSRFEFYGWSDGETPLTTEVTVYSPLNITALFGKQYLVSLVPENSNGQGISPVGYYNISGQQTDSNSIYLFSGKTYNIEYIYYKNVTIATDYHFTPSAPTTISFKTPVYDVAIQTQSIFGSTVNASLNITFKNNTHLMLYSGNTGTQNFQNVPYGYVSGYANYLGLRESINLADGEDSYLTFITTSLVAYIVAGILLIIAVARIAVYYERKRELGKNTTKKG